jgi:hypothetical protein
MGISNLLSAFRGLPRTISTRSAAYDVDDLAHVAGGRDCFVVVLGNPFLDRGCDGEAFIETVVAAMQGRNHGPATHFTARSSLNAHSDYRVTLLFNGGSAATARAADLCAGNGPRIPTESLDARGRIRILAAWCREDLVLSEVSGWVAGVKSPVDRRFTRLIAQVTRELFPIDVQPGGLKGH